MLARSSWRRTMRLSLLTLVVTAAPGAPTTAAGPSVLDPAGVHAAPDWVVPGTRMTFYVATASVADSRYELVEDPEGRWQDPQTGKRYRKTDESGDGTISTSSDGVAHVDILALDVGSVAYTVTAWRIDREGGIFVPGPQGGDVVPGGAVEGLWIAPDLLASLVDSGADGVTVLRGSYALDGVTYDAVSLVRTGDEGYASSTYDSVTGVLLASSSDTPGAISPVRLDGQDAPQGGDLLTTTRLMSVRVRHLPGLGDADPSWLADIRELRYTGSVTVIDPLDSSASSSSETAHDVLLGEGGAGWTRYESRSTTTIAGAPEITEVSSVTGPAGHYWIAPGALADLAVADGDRDGTRRSERLDHARDAGHPRDPGLQHRGGRPRGPRPPVRRARLRHPAPAAVAEASASV